MKRLPTIVTFLVLGASVSLAQSNGETPYVPGELIVQIMPDGNMEKILDDNAELDGNPTNIRLNKLLSAPMYAYLLTFDEGVDEFALKEQVNRHPDISLVQFNHYIEQRILPNDPQLNQQWWHTNIDSDNAWDITTGGLTATGDTIVVCVVDDGGDLDHPDLMANNWVNHNEIPNNNIDDDNNGYVDDYLGWNPPNNDNVDGGSHGVSVAGMVGAVGDNNTGLVGVNWNVKIMNMTYQGAQESSVIAAYTYPLVMRNLYESTGGAQGAYVVATNSSWGIDGGNPANAPLWCAFYDTLGAAGILSCGATANNNVNIDVVGDLPTACASEYMVSVTATDDNDIRQFSAYGATTIDLGAPGDQVRTTAGGGGYTTTSGTSFASPCTAGAIALVYSSPCASLAQISHADPALAAQMVRDAIFDGVDPIANLSGECVTGGRLNTKNAIDEIMNNCASAGCLAPFNLSASGLTDTQADIAWSNIASQDDFNLEYGEVGMAGTTVSNLTASPYTITGLTACADYWVAVQADCDSSLSPWSDTLYFTTDGCCEPPTGIIADNITSSGADISWNAVLAATSYNIRYQLTSGGTFTEVTNWPFTTVSIPLDECSEYEVQIATNCNGTTTAYSASYIFTSGGCGACVEETYCASSADNADDDWIDQVEFNTIDNTSGSDGGYGDYTTISTNLTLGETYSITITPDYDLFFVPSVNIHAWIDWDQNGNLTNADKIIDGVTTNANVAITEQVMVPWDADLGSTRMRIKMTEGNNGNACQASFNYGEVEDYCIMILDTATGIRDLNSGQLMFGMYPNPTSDLVTINLSTQLSDVVVSLTDLQGRVLMQRTETAARKLTLDVSTLTKGIYLVTTTESTGKTGTKKLNIR